MSKPPRGGSTSATHVKYQTSETSIEGGRDHGLKMNSGQNSQRPFSDYREFAVPPELRSHFLCFWTQVIIGTSQRYVHRVLPDGCVDIVFINGRPAEVVGPWTGPLLVQFSSGTKIFGARLRPGCASAVLGVPAVNLLNRSVELSAVWSVRRSSEVIGIAERPTLAERVAALSDALVSRLKAAKPSDPAVVAGVSWLTRRHEGSIDDLSAWLGISHRQLQRRFLNAIGYGPKMLQSVLRFQRLLYALGGKRPGRTLAALAADLGYSDQAHMTREVQRFANCSPTALAPSAQCTLVMSDLFKTHSDLPDYCRRDEPETFHDKTCRDSGRF